MHITELLEYKAWADEILYERCSEVPDDQLGAPQKIVFGSLLNTLHHVYTVDLIFKAHLTGKAHGLTTRRPTESPPVSTLATNQRDLDAWYIKHAASLDVETMNESITFTFVDGGEATMTREEMFLHIVNHTTYHRGHIGTMLYDMSFKPPTSDYTVYLRDRSKA